MTMFNMFQPECFMRRGSTNDKMLNYHGGKCVVTVAGWGGLALCFPQFLIMKEGSREGRGVENMWYGKRYKTYTDRLYDFFPFRP